MGVKRWVLLCFAVLAALALAAPAGAGKTKRVGLGDYAATMVLDPADRDATYVQGLFSVVKSKTRRLIAPTEGYSTIRYPDANECEKFDGALIDDAIPINRKGRFVHRERTPVAGGFVQVTWRGRWSAPRVVSGAIVVRFGDCVSRHRWSGAPAS